MYGRKEFVLSLLVFAVLFLNSCDDGQEQQWGFGEDCEVDGDCESDMCRRSRCTIECDDESPCQDGSGCTDGICDLLQRPIENLNIGMMYTGVVGDYGWTRMHDNSRHYLLEVFPDATIEYSLSVTGDAAHEEIRNFISNGANIIIGTGIQFFDAMVIESPNFPDINFLLCVPRISGPNLGAYYGRIYHVLYLAGVAAGYATTTNKVGIIGAEVGPHPVRYINAFALGLQSSNPDAVVIVRWAGSWSDVELDIQSTEDLVDVGVDVVATTTNNIVHMETLVGRTTDDGDPIYAICRGMPETCNIAPDTCLTTVYFNWGPFLVEIINDMQNGTWITHEDYWRGMAENQDDSVVALAPVNANVLTAEEIDDIESKRRLLATDPVHPFIGPISDSTETIRLEDGETPTVDQLLSMCWFVNGIYDTTGLPAVVPADCIGER